MDFALARHYMIENQLRTNRIDDPGLVAALSAVPREIFLPKKLRGVAYVDEDIDLGGGRRLIEPLALAKLLKVSAPASDEVALVAGCDTGYCAAVLARMVATVFHLAADEAAGTAVEHLMEEIGCDNVVVQTGDCAHGLPAQAPFGLVVVAGGVPSVPEVLALQLEDGGRLACVVTSGRSGKVTVRRRVGEWFGDSTPFDAWIPGLDAFGPAPEFAF
ncbi:MAG: protein-L-isoaspartate O-methyltransferase [Geminicoccaceae bacterium]|nr:protein-L-isoaspartate O-methyltransferase [Geminicoccaceae bacterium]